MRLIRSSSTVNQLIQTFSLSDVGKCLKSLVQSEGALGLWRGLGASLYRDVPFSGFYWAVYESLKSHYEVSSPTLLFSFAGGAIAGSVSLSVVHKTLHHLSPNCLFYRRQLSSQHHLTWWKLTSKSNSGKKFCIQIIHKSHYIKLKRTGFCSIFIAKMVFEEFSLGWRRECWKWHRLAPLWFRLLNTENHSFSDIMSIIISTKMGLRNFKFE